MNAAFRKLNLTLLGLHVVSWFGLFYLSGAFIYLFAFSPIPILALTIVFGSGLGHVSDLLLRLTSALLLIGGIYQANLYVCCSGEQGAVGVPVVVALVMGIYILVYGFLAVVTFLKNWKTNN